MQAGVPAGWVAGDEVHRADPVLRATVRHLGLRFVFQVAANRRVVTDVGPIRSDQLPTLVPTRAWQTYSAGPGSGGHRWYDWAWVAIHPEDPHDAGCRTRRPRRSDAGTAKIVVLARAGDGEVGNRASRHGGWLHVLAYLARSQGRREGALVAH